MGRVSGAARTNEDGTVLLSTLLVLALMSAVALGLMATVRHAVRAAQTTSETAQAELYADGAEHYARAVVASLGLLDGPVLNEALLKAEPVLLPFDGGFINASVRDGTHCIRLSGLTDASGQANQNEVLRLSALMRALGLPTNEASRLAATAADWVDRDSVRAANGAEDGPYLFRDPPHRTANVPFASPAELRALDGMTEEVFQLLRPHVCIGKAGTETKFNIDTMDARHLPVLAALTASEGDGMALAAEILAARPRGGFGGETALKTTVPSLQDEDTVPTGFMIKSITYAPDRLVVEALIQFGTVERARVYGFESIKAPEPTITYRDWGRSAFQPVAAVPEEGEQP